MSSTTVHTRGVAVATAVALMALLLPLLGLGTGAATAAEPEPDEAQAAVESTDDDPTCVTYKTLHLRRAMWRTGGADTRVVGGTAVVGGIPADACAFQVNFSSYELPSGKIRPFQDQLLFDNVSRVFAGADVATGDQLTNGASLAVALPQCAWQTDLYLGDNVLGDEPLDVEWPAPHDASNPGVSTPILLDYDYQQTTDRTTCTDDAPPSAAVSIEGCDGDTASIVAVVDTTDDPAVTARLEVTGDGYDESVEVEVPGGVAATELRLDGVPDGDYTYRVLIDGDEVASGATTIDCVELLPITVALETCLSADEAVAGQTNAHATLINQNDVEVLATITGATLATVDGVDQPAGTTTVTLPPGSTPVVLADVSAGDVVIVSIDDAPDAELGIVDDCEIGVTVDKTNDADTDGTHTDDETAAAAAAAVEFRLEVTNIGEIPGTVRLVDSFDGTQVVLFGDDAEVTTSCELEGDPFDADDELGPGETIVCLVTLDEYSPALGGAIDNVVTATLQTRLGDTTDEDDSTVRTRPAAPAIEIVKTNDADVDGLFSDDEVAPDTGTAVEFDLLVTNTGEIDGPVRLLDELDDGTELFLFGLDPSASPDVTTTCVRVGGAADGDSFGADDVLAVGEVVRCGFTLPAYSPTDPTDARVNIATVELVEVERDDAGAVTGVDPIATDEDDSTVRSQLVLDTDVTPDDDGPTGGEGDGGPTDPVTDDEDTPRVLPAAVQAPDQAPVAQLARTGASVWELLAAAVLMLGLGVLFVIRSGRRARRS